MTSNIFATVVAAQEANAALCTQLHHAADLLSDVGRNGLPAAVQRLYNELALCQERLSNARSEAAGILADHCGWYRQFASSLKKQPPPAEQPAPRLGAPAVGSPPCPLCQGAGEVRGQIVPCDGCLGTGLLHLADGDLSGSGYSEEDVHAAPTLGQLAAEEAQHQPIVGRCGTCLCRIDHCLCHDIVEEEDDPGADLAATVMARAN